MSRMEVFYEPPVFVKAHGNYADRKLLLTVFHSYRSIFVAYQSIGTELDPASAVRHGLEKMVAHYPWAAGRIGPGTEQGSAEDQCLQVCFNDDGGPGAQFVSARVNCALAHFGDLGDPNPAFQPLFATVDMSAPLHARPLVALQVTRFEDGGVCVSMTWNHTLFDGVAAAIFLQNTASCARGGGVCIEVDKAPRELRIKPSAIVPLMQSGCWPSYLHKSYTKERTEKHKWRGQLLQATRFDFSQEDLAQLRLEALGKQQDCGRGFKACSRFQALAAHLWKARAQSLLCGSGEPSEAFPLRIAVNVRGRIVSSIPLNYLGNAITPATATATLQELNERSLAFAVEKIQEAIREVSADRFQAEVDYLTMLGGGAQAVYGTMDLTSVVGLGFFEADFGWGKPAYYGRPCEQRRIFYILCDANAHYTAWKFLAAFDSQVELCKFREALQL